ncbi:MAG: lipocalin family protein [Arenimonas sp.]|nr:lipocalin family protein [Arenimonas sp.]MBP7917141.1 lipocalin family protein [Arenimonas sp.]
MNRLPLIVLLVLSGCTGKPDNIKPVENFQADRYLGTWYEIARIDHRFEKGLTRVTAEYSLREDGGIQVINRGYAAESGVWKQSLGKARFVDGKDKGHLKVSFFGPFYGAYVVFELDKTGYQYALVSGPDTSYFWLLSRTPVMDSALRDRLIDRAVAEGFRRDDILLVDQSGQR